MASSLLLLLDDIASVLDDVATMTKVAAKKTAGVLGDDLALNAKQVAGVDPARELAVVWAVAKGSSINKLILVPAALAISWLVPWVIPPLLVLGGAFLCYEGAEKILHAIVARGHHGHEAGAAPPDDVPSPAGGEARKIAGAVRTDFILSAEIIVIALDVVTAQPLATQVGVLSVVAVLMTIGVYGLVAAIVKLDDLGAALAGSRVGIVAALGRGLVAAAPWLMRGLSIAGTAAMFLVGGGIIVHRLPWLHHAVEVVLDRLAGGGHGPLGPLATKSADAVCGLAVGMMIVAAMAAGRRVLGRSEVKTT